MSIALTTSWRSALRTHLRISALSFSEMKVAQKSVARSSLFTWPLVPPSLGKTMGRRQINGNHSKLNNKSTNIFKTILCFSHFLQQGQASVAPETFVATKIY